MFCREMRVWFLGIQGYLQVGLWCFIVFVSQDRGYQVWRNGLEVQFQDSCFFGSTVLFQFFLVGMILVFGWVLQLVLVCVYKIYFEVYRQDLFFGGMCFSFVLVGVFSFVIFSFIFLIFQKYFWGDCFIFFFSCSYSCFLSWFLFLFYFRLVKGQR